MRYTGDLATELDLYLETLAECKGTFSGHITNLGKREFDSPHVTRLSPVASRRFERELYDIVRSALCFE